MASSASLRCTSSDWVVLCAGQLALPSIASSRISWNTLAVMPSVERNRLVLRIHPRPFPRLQGCHTVSSGTRMLRVRCRVESGSSPSVTAGHRPRGGDPLPHWVDASARRSGGHRTGRCATSSATPMSSTPPSPGAPVRRIPDAAERPREWARWSPMQRGLLPVHGAAGHPLARQDRKRYTTTTDTAFDDVLPAAPTPARGILDRRAHRLGLPAARRDRLAHSVEGGNPDGDLVGGLYGFRWAACSPASRSFHDPELGRDASKERPCCASSSNSTRRGSPLLDVQWLHPSTSAALAPTRCHGSSTWADPVVAGLPTRPSGRTAAA